MTDNPSRKCSWNIVACRFRRSDPLEQDRLVPTEDKAPESFCVEHGDAHLCWYENENGELQEFEYLV